MMRSLPKPAVYFLLVCFFVSPLIFFTDLTRNPYHTQITLLNLALWLCALFYALRAALGHETVFPKTPLDLPWAAWLAMCLLSWVISYYGHPGFFRPAIISEGTKAWLFLFANCFLAYRLALQIPVSREPHAGRESAAAVLMVIWGILWYLFPALRADAAAGGLWSSLWDPYGCFVWAVGIFSAWRIVRPGFQEDFLLLAMTAGGIASAYGVLQYFQVEWIWPRILNPYGTRSVSTFGNPNFLSSFLVMLVPLALARLLKAGSLFNRVFYASLLFLYEGDLLCSLTRSSWLGAGIALGTLLFSAGFRTQLALKKKLLAFMAAAGVSLVLFWPSSSAGGQKSSVFERIHEIRQIEAGDIISAPEKAASAYAPWHQRLLIWASCWQMGLENPFTGKGFGQLELFYPFYQGPLLLAYPGFIQLRTHANNAHNELLENFSQTGIAGLGIFLWLFTALLAWFAKSLALPGPDNGYWTWAMLSGAVGMAADNLLNVSLHFAVPGFLFWWLIGCVCARISGRSGATINFKIKNSAPKAFLAVLALSACGLASYFWLAGWMREAHYFAGFKFMRRNEFAAAAKELKLAYDWNPRDVNNNYELGNAYARLEDQERALWAYGEALKANPGYDEIYFNKAVLLAKKMGLWEKAVAALEVSLWINPTNRLTCNLLAEAYVRDPKTYARAGAEIFDQAASVFRDEPNYFNTAGYFHTLLKQPEKARKYFAEGLKIQPSNVMLEANLRKVMADLKISRDPALDWVKDFRELEASVSRSDFSDDTLRLAQKLAEENPEDSKSRVYLGLLLLRKNRPGEAEKRLKEAAGINPEDAQTHFLLSVLYEMKGDRSSALAEAGESLRINPDYKEAREKFRALSGISAPQ